MKRYFLFVLCCLMMGGIVKVQAIPEVEAQASFVNHEGKEEVIEEMGSIYDAPLTVTFAAIFDNPADTVGYDILYEWEINQTKDNLERLLVKRNEETSKYTFTEGGTNVSYSIGLSITYRNRE